MLRIDPETGSPATYTVPATNPFAQAPGYRPEIWALGLRNPWRFSFDRETGDLYLGDVGQGSWEEVDFQPGTSGGGENYGWRVFEGLHCTNIDPCASGGLTFPVTEYAHGADCSITGGFVYRGGQYLRMQGVYYYGDYCSGYIRAMRREGNAWVTRFMTDTPWNISAFGEDESGGLYVLDHGLLGLGAAYQITDTVAPATATPTRTPTPTATSTPTPLPTCRPAGTPPAQGTPLPRVQFQPVAAGGACQP
jgi:hypothetical protein